MTSDDECTPPIERDDEPAPAPVRRETFIYCPPSLLATAELAAWCIGRWVARSSQPRPPVLTEAEIVAAWRFPTLGGGGQLS